MKRVRNSFEDQEVSSTSTNNSPTPPPQLNNNNSQNSKRVQSRRNKAVIVAETAVEFERYYLEHKTGGAANQGHSDSNSNMSKLEERIRQNPRNFNNIPRSNIIGEQLRSNNEENGDNSNEDQSDNSDGSSSILKGILQNGSSYNYSAVRFGRVPKREKAKIVAAMLSSRMKTQESKVLAEMADETKIVETVVRAHYDTCDYTRNKIEPFVAKAKVRESFAGVGGTTCPMKGRPEDSFLEQFSERFMDHVRQVCTFAKLIPGFKCLHHDDQVTLLKSCVFEVLMVRLAGLFENQGLICLNGDIILKESIEAMPAGNAKFLMDSVFELAQRINQFRLSDAEIGLFCAVVIITPDRPGLRNPDLIQKMQAKLKQVMSSILLPQHPEHGQRVFNELMAMIIDLRTLNTLHTEKFLQQCRIPPGHFLASSANGASSTSGSVASSASTAGSLEGSASQQAAAVAAAPVVKANGNNVCVVNGHGPTGPNIRPQPPLDRESTGNASPQSTSDASSSEDQCSLMRRSPIGSVSSTESVQPQDIIHAGIGLPAVPVSGQAAASGILSPSQSKYTVHDLRVSNSVLLNALAIASSSTSASINPMPVTSAAQAAQQQAAAAAALNQQQVAVVVSRPPQSMTSTASVTITRKRPNEEQQQSVAVNGSAATVTKVSKTTKQQPMALQQQQIPAIQIIPQVSVAAGPSAAVIITPAAVAGPSNNPANLSTNSQQQLCSSPPRSTTSSAADSGIHVDSSATVPGDRKSPGSPNSAGGTSSSSSTDEAHPLLKRALQKPVVSIAAAAMNAQPQQGSSTSFQDEVYKPHKKFRRHNVSEGSGGDNSPTSSTIDLSNHSNGSQQQKPRPANSLLISRLESPIVRQSGAASSALAAVLTSQHQQQQPKPTSLLASTLSRGLARPEDYRRNEILANLIVNGSVNPNTGAIGSSTSSTGGRISNAASTSSSPLLAEQLSRATVKPETTTTNAAISGLLMCAVSNSGNTRPAPVPMRHIPVQITPAIAGPSRLAAPAQPLPAAAMSKMSQLAEVAAAVASAEEAAPQPLNLCKRPSESGSDC